MSFFGNFESKKEGIDDTVEWILRVTVVTLAAIMMAVIVTLMFGLFVKDVDNTEVFAIIGPAFNTIVGAFVGLLGGLSLNANARDKKPDEPAPEEPLELTPEMEVVEHKSVPFARTVEPEPVVEDEDEDDDDDMEPWEKYRNDLRYDANGDGVVDAEDFPDWRNPAV
jgi:hypothetical protein